MGFTESLIELMKAQNINSIDLQNYTGIKESTFRAWKKGSQPSADKIILLAKYFNVTTDELLGLEPGMKLSENDKELLDIFHQLPEREQIKLIGKIEEIIERTKDKNV